MVCVERLYTLQSLTSAYDKKVLKEENAVVI